MRTLQDRVAVVTGAASGIGQATARSLAAQGARVALVDLDLAGLRSLSDTLPGSSWHAVDVGDREAMAALPGQVLERHGAVHVVVNNAGITVVKSFVGHTLQDWDRVLAVNLAGVLHGCHFFLPHLLRAEEAHIVNISSVFGLVGVPGQSAYCTTKYAVRGLSETLWEELHGTGVGVTVVHPGGVRTNIVANATGDDEETLQRMRRVFGRMPVTPDMVGARIVRAILRGERRVLVTREAYAADLVRRMLPVAGNRFAVRAMARFMRLQLPTGRALLPEGKD